MVVTKRKKIKKMSDIFEVYDDEDIMEYTLKYLERRLDGFKDKKKKLHNLSLFTYLKMNLHETSSLR